MSVCDHDASCPGHGQEHDAAMRMRAQAAALLDQLPSESLRRYVEQAATVERTTRINPDKDRRLNGKARKKARRGH